MSAPTTAEVREALVQAELAETAFVNTQPAATAFFAVRAVLETTALPLAEERDAERARADAAEAEVGRRGELLAAERERYVALQRTLDNDRHAAMDKSAALMAAEAEVGRMRKLFDDAGQGTYDVLALVEHWQAEAMRMASENDRFREALDIVCQWWGGCGHHPDDCPEDDAGELVEDECKASKRVAELTKGEGR